MGKAYKPHMRLYIMVKQNPKQKEVTRIVWSLECPKCKKEITGNYEAQAIRNLESHLDKHNKLEKENKK